MNRKVTILIIAAILLLGITGPKLFKMCQIRGWIPGAIVVNEIVTDKWNQSSVTDSSEGNIFWISWGDKSIEIKGNHRENLEQEDWQQIEIGQSIEIITLPGSDMVYVSGGIFANNGNFAFDIILLIIEIGVVLKYGIEYYREYSIKKAGKANSEGLGQF